MLKKRSEHGGEENGAECVSWYRADSHNERIVAPEGHEVWWESEYSKNRGAGITEDVVGIIGFKNEWRSPFRNHVVIEEKSELWRWKAMKCGGN